MDTHLADNASDRAAHGSAADGRIVAYDGTLVDPAEHNVVFTSLVTGDTDIVGLVAYSIYKQNKYDWLLALSRAHQRTPTEAEAESYLLGESTPRRLATYRHLAEATLEGRGLKVPGQPDSPAGPGRPFPVPARTVAAARRAPLSLTHPVVLGLVGVLAAIALLLWVLHVGPPAKP